MEILTSPDSNNNLSLALGFFDGVHIAHKKILSTAAELAQKNGLKSAVITFKKSPGAIINPSNPAKNINLQTLEDKLSLIEEIGVDFAYVLDFEDFKHLSAKEYLNDVLIKNFAPRFIVTDRKSTRLNSSHL